MATTILFKRGNAVNFPALTLLDGEPAWIIDDKQLYIGDGIDKILINPLDESTYNSWLATISALGTASLADVGTNVGDVPVVLAGGKLDPSIIPSSFINNVYVVNSQAAMLALPANVGDIAIRTDINETFILSALPASTLSNWIQLLFPTAVQSVNGQTGVVVLTKADVGLGNVDNESKSTMFTNPSFTGVPTAPTAPAGTDTTQIATTAYVQNSIQTIDGGTF